jgi:hypothetical protein
MEPIPVCKGQFSIDPMFGEKAIGLSFNPSGNSAVQKCKEGYAELINQLNELRHHSKGGEQKRLASIAITEAQGAQMWAVKAITWVESPV